MIQYYQKKFNTSKVSQGSSDWLDGRQYCIGGSEIATVLGTNKHDTFENLKSIKQGKIYSPGNDYTQWGLMFETVAKQFITKKKGTIYEFGSIPHCQYPVCYSPDGILIEGEDLVLLEIKSPIMRGIATIPEYYYPQIYTGMNVLHVKYTLFVQCRFRRCKFGTNPLNTVYDRGYHKEYRKRCKDTYPISWGVLWWNVDSPVRDLAELPLMYPKISTFTKEVDGHTEWMKPEILIEPEHFKPEKGYVLKWKLFEMTYTKVLPKKHYLDNIADLLWSKYKEIRLQSDPELQGNKLESMNSEEEKVEDKQPRIDELLHTISQKSKSKTPETNRST